MWTYPYNITVSYRTSFSISDELPTKTNTSKTVSMFRFTIQKPATRAKFQKFPLTSSFSLNTRVVDSAVRLSWPTSQLIDAASCKYVAGVAIPRRRGYKRQATSFPGLSLTRDGASLRAGSLLWVGYCGIAGKGGAVLRSRNRPILLYGFTDSQFAAPPPLPVIPYPNKWDGARSLHHDSVSFFSLLRFFFTLHPN